MNKNADTQTAMATEIALSVITNKTTLGEVLSMLGLTAGQKSLKRHPRLKNFASTSSRLLR